MLIEEPVLFSLLFLFLDQKLPSNQIRFCLVLNPELWKEPNQLHYKIYWFFKNCSFRIHKPIFIRLLWYSQLLLPNFVIVWTLGLLSSCAWTSHGTASCQLPDSNPNVTFSGRPTPTRPYLTWAPSSPCHTSEDHPKWLPWWHWNTIGSYLDLFTCLLFAFHH